MSQEQPKTAKSILPKAISLRPALTRFLARRLPASDVEDVLQDIFVNLAKSKSSAGVENAQAYLFRVAVNAVAAHARRSRTSPHLVASDLKEPTDEGLSVERILISRQELDAVRQDILALPERTRDVFMLHRFEEMSYPEIAERLSISVSAVEKHMMKALRRVLEAANRR